MYEAIENTIVNLKQAQAEIASALDLSAIEAVLILFELMLGQEDEQLALLDREKIDRIKDTVEQAKFSELAGDGRRQVLQLLLVATQRQDQLQANYQVTPDAIGMWFAYLVNHLIGDKQNAKILDLGVGSGNLLATVSQSLTNVNEYVAVENDDTLITLASGVAGLLEQSWELIHEDAMQLDQTDTFDIVIGDLPVGYYPKTAPANFITANQADELSYVHHLLIEKSVELLKAGGTALLLVPARIFENEATDLLQLIQTDHVYMQAFMRFPGKMFANAANAKALLVLQKQGSSVKQASPVLLADIPSYIDQEATQRFLSELTEWLTDNQL